MLFSFFFLPCMVSSRWTLFRGLGTGEIVIKILLHLFKGSGKLMYKKLRSSSHINNWSVDGLSKLGQPSLDPLSRLVRCAPTPPGTRLKTPSTDRLRTVRPNWVGSQGSQPCTSKQGAIFLHVSPTLFDHSNGDTSIKSKSSYNQVLNWVI